MADINGLLQGLATGLDGYLGKQQDVQNKMAEMKATTDYATQKEQSKQIAMEGRQVDLEHLKNQDKLSTDKQLEDYKQSKEGVVTPDMAASSFKGAGAEGMSKGASDWVTGFHDQNGRYPTVKEVHEGLDAVKKAISNSNDMQDPKHQSALFEKGKSAIMSARGDPALGDIQKQQTAVGMGYKSLVEARTGKMALTPTVWNDVIGQVWKARAGSAPTKEVMNDLDQKNIVGAMSKTLNYFTGYQANANVQPKVVQDNMLDFLKNTGEGIDDRYHNLMASHLVQDPELSDANQKRLQDVVDARTFARDTAKHQQSYQALRDSEGKYDQGSSIEAKRAETRRKLELH